MQLEEEHSGKYHAGPLYQSRPVCWFSQIAPSGSTWRIKARMAGCFPGCDLCRYGKGLQLVLCSFYSYFQTTLSMPPQRYCLLFTHEPTRQRVNSDLKTFAQQSRPRQEMAHQPQRWQRENRHNLDHVIVTCAAFFFGSSCCGLLSSSSQDVEPGVLYLEWFEGFYFLCGAFQKQMFHRKAEIGDSNAVLMTEGYTS